MSVVSMSPVTRCTPRQQGNIETPQVRSRPHTPKQVIIYVSFCVYTAMATIYIDLSLVTLVAVTQRCKLSDSSG